MRGVGELVEAGEDFFRGGKVLGRGFLEPLEGLFVGLGDAGATRIDDAEIELGGGVALFGGFAEPDDGVFVGLGRALAEHVGKCEAELGINIA